MSGSRHAGDAGDGAARAATYSEVFAVAEFRTLWVAQLLSRAGDQLAAVALAVLVFGRTGSTLATALTYSLTFLPWLVGGPLLAGLADRLPRRQVMVGCDLARAGLVGLMALPGVPLAVLFVLLFLVVLLESPFSAARAATLPEVLAGDRYVVGSSVVSVTNEVAQVAGFAVGGALVALIGTSGALVVNAATFGVSAALLMRLRHRPAAVPDPDGASLGSLLRLRGAREGLREGLLLVSGHPALRRLTLLAWLCAFYAVPEALAVPYAHQAGEGSTVAGLLLAANPAGAVIGSVCLGRFVAPARRMRLMGPLAVLSCAPLVACVTTPAWWVAGLLWFVSGLGSSYNLPANAAFVAAVPAGQRGQAFGLVGSGMAVGQGLALVLAGAAAELWSAGAVIAVAGAAGVCAALLLARALHRSAAPELVRS